MIQNTNTNNIRFQKVTRMRIRILVLGLKCSNTEFFAHLCYRTSSDLWRLVQNGDAKTTFNYLTSQSPHSPKNPLFQTTPLPFSFRAPPMPGLRWRNPQLSHITLRPGGWGRIYTPYNYIWKPSRSWFRARSKKSPWGDYTSSGHAFIPLLVCRDAPAYEIWYDMVGALPVW